MSSCLSLLTVIRETTVVLERGFMVGAEVESAKGSTMLRRCLLGAGSLTALTIPFTTPVSCHSGKKQHITFIQTGGTIDKDYPRHIKVIVTVSVCDPQFKQLFCLSYPGLCFRDRRASR